MTDWLNKDVHAITALDSSISAALNKVHEQAKRRKNEKTFVKTLVTDEFVHSLESSILTAANDGWVPIVSTGYIDTIPRVAYVETGEEKEIELGDLLLLKTIHQRDKPTDHGRAWLIQAKQTEDKVIPPPPVTDADNGADQLYFSKTWPEFDLYSDKKGRSPSSVRKKINKSDKFSIPKSLSLEWWGVTWGGSKSTIPSGLPWDSNSWVVCPAIDAPEYESFGKAIRRFLSDAASYGEKYIPSPIDGTKTPGWNELITALIELCPKRRITSPFGSGPSHPAMPGMATSSLEHFNKAVHAKLMTLAQPTNRYKLPVAGRPIGQPWAYWHFLTEHWEAINPNFDWWRKYVDLAETCFGSLGGPPDNNIPDDVAHEKRRMYIINIHLINLGEPVRD